MAPETTPRTTPPDALTLPPGYVAALDKDGRLVALPTPDPATPSETDPAPTESAPAGLPPIVGQIVLLGSAATLAASGALWLAAAALRTAAPALPTALDCLKWAALFVALVVGGVVAAKVRTRTGATLSVWHTTKTTHIGPQTVKGRNNRGITNHL
jgi:hypothetical protein